MCLSDGIIVGKFWAREFWTAAACMGPLIAQGSSHLWLADVKCSSAKQAGSEWLQISLLGLHLRQLDVWRFEFSAGGLGACCEEV